MTTNYEKSAGERVTEETRLCSWILCDCCYITRCILLYDLYLEDNVVCKYQIFGTDFACLFPMTRAILNRQRALQNIKRTGVESILVQAKYLQCCIGTAPFSVFSSSPLDEQKKGTFNARSGDVDWPVCSPQLHAKLFLNVVIIPIVLPQLVPF